jgi:hypothetical protein
VVSFTHRLLYPWGKSPRYQLDRRLGGPQSRSGRRGENSRPYRDSNSDPSVVQPIASRYTDYATQAPCVSYSSHNKRQVPLTALTGWALWRRPNVFPARYELNSYIIFRRNSRVNLCFLKLCALYLHHIPANSAVPFIQL